MDPKKYSVALESGLDLRQLVTTGSVLHINQDYDAADETDTHTPSIKTVDHIGEPVQNINELSKTMKMVDKSGFVKKKIIEEGGGMPLHKGCTASIAFSGFWEGNIEPFDCRKLHKPLVVDLNDNDILPGLQIAVESMLVGEMSVFILSYQVMYGELGIPPRIKPKTDCIFYIKLLRSILTPKEKEIDFSEPNTFKRVHKEVRLLYSSGFTLFKSNNYTAAIQLFRKAVTMLHKCRLADEEEEKVQEKMLIKLYTNLTICYNKTKQPLKACTCCNELNRLNSLWNNSKALFLNAKALRMIGQYEAAAKRLTRALKLTPDSEEIKDEIILLEKTKELCNQNKLLVNVITGESKDLLSEEFKEKVDELIKSFKQNDDLCKLTLPEGLNTSEVEYIKQACIRENLFFNNVQKECALDKDEIKSSGSVVDSSSDFCLLDKEDSLCSSSFFEDFNLL